MSQVYFQSTDLIASDSENDISEIFKNSEHDITKIERLLLGERWYNLIDIYHSFESVSTSNFRFWPKDGRSILLLNFTNFYQTIHLQYPEVNKLYIHNKSKLCACQPEHSEYTVWHMTGKKKLIIIIIIIIIEFLTS